MKYYKFNTIYANGSSLTAGGGLDHRNIRDEYKKLYNVEWGDEKDITYPKYIADHFGCRLVHDAMSGAGAPRLVRRTYEYIKKVGITQSQKTLFLFEITSPVHRVDLYCEEVGEYVITNVRYDDDDNTGDISSIQMHKTTNRYGVEYGYDYFEGKISNEVKDYLSKYHNPVEYVEKVGPEVAGLFSFLEKNNIEFFYWFDDESLKNSFQYFYNKLDKERNLKFENYNCVNQFCNFNGHSIKAELKGFTEDIHPGYFGNKLYSEKIIELIEEKIKPRLYTFGDSHTQTFKSHKEANTSWAKEYINHIGEVPETYNEILANKINIELNNFGKGGASNQTIFDIFIENYKNIKPNDIVIFGWTGISRFRLSSNVNTFVDVLPNPLHPKQNDDVTKESEFEISINRDSYTIWWSEVKQYIEIIQALLPKNKILHWTWVDTDIVTPTNIWSQESIDLKLSLLVHNWVDTEEKIKNVIIDNCDYLVDLSGDVDIDDLKIKSNEGKKIIFINSNQCDENIRNSVFNEFRIKFYDSKNYKKECFDLMIPHKRYNRIYDETNGTVDDLHTSKNGHIQLSEDLLEQIKKPII
jgi:hypothetical protein